MTFTEIPANQSITPEALANNTELAKEVQINLIRLGLLDPPADGKFGLYSRQALEEFQSLMNLSEFGLGIQTRKALAGVKEVFPLQLGNDFASRIIKYMQQKQYFVAVGKQKYNIVYVEGANSNGAPNGDWSMTHAIEPSKSNVDAQKQAASKPQPLNGEIIFFGAHKSFRSTDVLKQIRLLCGRQELLD
jgi:hypothetical protein